MGRYPELQEHGFKENSAFFDFVKSDSLPRVGVEFGGIQRVAPSLADFLDRRLTSLFQ